MRESCLDVPQVWFKPFWIKESTLCTSCQVLTTADQNVTLPTSHLRTMNIKRDCWNSTLISVHFGHSTLISPFSLRPRRGKCNINCVSLSSCLYTEIFLQRKACSTGRKRPSQTDLKTHESNSTLWHKCIASKSTEQYRTRVSFVREKSIRYTPSCFFLRHTEGLKSFPVGEVAGPFACMLFLSH